MKTHNCKNCKNYINLDGLEVCTKDGDSFARLCPSDKICSYYYDILSGQQLFLAQPKFEKTCKKKNKKCGSVEGLIILGIYIAFYISLMFWLST